MNYIKIKRLALENFKCHRNLVLDFNGGNASIYGDNATGKTSVYDALTWLLFGKDSHGNGEKNIEIKPLGEDGEVRDHNAITAVEAVLLVNGEEVTLRRTYQEVWSTKRGRGEATYDGNTSEYYIDGVPVKKYAFSEAVDALVNEDTFRMLTSVSHFADGISWQARREVLFRVANVAGDREIMLNDEKFFPLIEGMGKLSLEDYKKKLLAEKHTFVGAKTDIPARISECQKTIEDVDGMDFGAARAKIEALTVEKDALEAELLSIERNTAAENKRMEIREVRLEQVALDNENKAYRLSQTVGAPNVDALRAVVNAHNGTLFAKESALEGQKRMIDDKDKQIADCRARWLAVNAEVFTGSNCPTCGQALPADKIRASIEAFEADKRKRLLEIERTASTLKAVRAEIEVRIAEITEEIEQHRTIIEGTQAKIDAAKGMIVTPVDMDGYAEKREEIQKRIDGLDGELMDIMSGTSAARAKLIGQISEIKNEIASWNVYLGKESLLEYSRKRVEELQEDARNAAEKLDAIEEVLFLIDEYSRYKTQFVEDSINGMFRIARFRLFREQANGGVEDRCDVVYDGVPYININSGAKINVGIDIINTLSRAYGVTVPLFVDNAESVTNLERSDCQIIRLVVSENDKKMRCDYEN